MKKNETIYRVISKMTSHESKTPKTNKTESLWCHYPLEKYNLSQKRAMLGTYPHFLLAGENTKVSSITAKQEGPQEKSDKKI